MANVKPATDASVQDAISSLDEKTRAWLDRIRPLLDRRPTPGGPTSPSTPDVLSFRDRERFPGFPGPAPVSDVDLLTAAIKAKDAHKVHQYATVIIVGGHDLGSIDSNGDIPVILAAQTNDFIITSLVIPFFPDRRNAAGETALIIATRFGNAKSVDLLLSKGASPVLKDNSQKSALDYAQEKQKANPTNKEFAQILKWLQEVVDKPNARFPAPKKTPSTKPKSKP